MPAAITGSEKLFLGPFPKPRRVQVAFSDPIEVAELAVTPEGAAEVVEAMVWPEVEGEFRRLRARPTLIAAGLAALGIGGGVFAQRRGVRLRAQEVEAALEALSPADQPASGPR